MSGRPVPSQLDQVLPRFYVQKAGPYHPFGRIRIAPFGKGGLRILAESGYILILRHDRRRLLWLGATTHPTAEWIARQLTEACGWDAAPRYLIRDRDRSYGEVFVRRVRAMGIRDRPTSPRSPWQNAYAERLIGSIRRECIDHVIVFGERHLRHLLGSYLDHYNETRTHLSLDKDAPISRAIQAVGRKVGCPVLSGLHHQYVRTNLRQGQPGSRLQ